MPFPQLAYYIVVLLITLGIWPAGTGVATPRNEAAIAELAGMSAPAEGFSFVVWGDCRDDQGKFDDVIARINELNPLFTVGLGDYISKGTRKEYDKFLHRITALNQPLISVIGNHDVSWGGRKIWAKEFGDTNFYFDFGGVRFICLDNSDSKLDADELDFLEDKLQTQMPRIVFAHAPPDYGRWTVHSFKNGSDAFLALLRKYEVEYAFFAHIHLYDKLYIGPTTCIISGGAGAPLYGNYNFGGPNIHVVNVTVKDGRITSEYVPVYGD